MDGTKTTIVPLLQDCSQNFLCYHDSLFGVRAPLFLYVQDLHTALGGDRGGSIAHDAYLFEECP